MLRFLLGLAVGWVGTWWLLTGQSPLVDRLSAWLSPPGASFTQVESAGSRPGRQR